MIVQIDNALSKKECRSFVRMYHSYLHLASGAAYDEGDHPALYSTDLQDLPETHEPLRRIVMQCWTGVSESLGLSFQIYPETVILSALGPGGSHPRHADNCKQNASGRWVPNHTPERVVTAIYYLNGDFDGGEIVFEQEGLVIKPRAGLLLAFPSDRHHVHEVLPVRRGMRYTIPIWFTKRKKAALSGFDRPDTIATMRGRVAGKERRAGRLHT
jgi:hypothetical protein